MTVEAIIDVTQETEKFEVGDNVGECGGIVTGYTTNNCLKARVDPEQALCRDCSLREPCTGSQAN